MHIIKLNAIDSTNAYLKTLSMETVLEDYTTVVANSQTKGRGQMGTNWQSQPSKNLTASVFKSVQFIRIEQQFYISMATSLAICKALGQFYIPQLHIKWPNDILSANKKIAGILIENVIKQQRLQGCIIGIGLNVNQKYFENLPTAASMQLLTGVVYDIDEVLAVVLRQLQYYFKLLEHKRFKDLKKEYESLMFRREKPSTFVDASGEQFTGYIKGVTEDGKLQVMVEDNNINTYDLKEIQLMY